MHFGEKILTNYIGVVKMDNWEITDHKKTDCKTETVRLEHLDDSKKWIVFEREDESQIAVQKYKIIKILFFKFRIKDGCALKVKPEVSWHIIDKGEETTLREQKELLESLKNKKILL